MVLLIFGQPFNINSLHQFFLARLKNLIDRIPENPSSNKASKESIHLEEKPRKDIDTEPIAVFGACQSVKPDDATLYDSFLVESNIKEELDDYKYNLEKKLEQAKMYAQALDQSQRNINFIRQKLEVVKINSKKTYLLHELDIEQRNYRKYLDELNQLKNETFHLENGLKQMETQAMMKFNQWKTDGNQMKRKNSNHEYNRYNPHERIINEFNYENATNVCHFGKDCDG